jgi:hypothetical protein
MRAKVMLALASVTYCAAWFLPSVVLPPPATWLPERIVVRGWQATREALSPIWAGYEGESPWLALLAVASASTNLLFVGSALWVLWRPHRISPRLAWAVGAATLINTHWLIADPELRAGLRGGYYLWLVSFGLLAVAVHWTRLSHSRERASPPAA